MSIAIPFSQQSSWFSLDDQRVVFDTSDEKRCKVNILSAIGKDIGMWNLNIALCRKDKKKQPHNFKITIGIYKYVSTMCCDLNLRAW